MKKFFSLVLALVMALSLTTVAWGATSVYVNGTTGDDTTTDSTVTPYKTLGAAVAAADDGATIYVAAGTYDKLATISGKTVTIDCEDGVVFTGTSSLNINGSTVDGATFSNPGGTVISGTINGIAKNCTFTGGNALRWCYTGATTEFYDCVLEGSTYGIHFDGGSTTALFDGCTISGFNAIGVPVTLRDCTFQAKEGNNYNGVNLWDDTVMEGCEFVFDGEAGTEWVDMCSANQTLKVTDSVVSDGAGGEKTLDTVVGRAVSAKNGDTFYSTLQDAIDEGGTVILMADAGEIDVPQGVTIVPNGNDVKVKAPTGGEVVKTTDGTYVVVPAVTRGDKFDLYVADAGMKDALAAGAEDVPALSFTEVAAKPNSDGSGNLAYIAANNGEYFVKTTNPTVADYAVTVAGKTDVLYYVSMVNVADMQYWATAKAFTNFGQKCGQLYRVDTTKEYYVIEKADPAWALQKDDVSYVVDPSTGVSYVNVLVGNEIKALAATPVDDTNTVLTIDEILGHNWAVTGVKATTTGKTIPTQVTCLNCGAVVTKFYDADTKVPAGTVATAVPGYEQATNTHDAWFFVEPAAASVSGTAVTPSTDKVQSADTFDAGIAMYVGMSVMAAAGSAVVIGKKKD